MKWIGKGQIATIRKYRSCHFQHWSSVLHFMVSYMYGLVKLNWESPSGLSCWKGRERYSLDKLLYRRLVIQWIPPLNTTSLCGGWVPKTSWSFHYWQPAPRQRLHRWLAKPDNNLAMNPPRPREDREPSHWYTVENRGWGQKGTKTAKLSTHNAPSSRHTDE